MLGTALEPASRRLSLPNPEATRRLGQRLGAAARPGDTLLLVGDLGAGKTTLTQGLAAGLGIDEAVTSPTFALLHEYPEGRLPLYHFDLYRLDEAQIRSQDFMDYWERGDGVAVLEWADHLGRLAPDEHLAVRLEHHDDARVAALEARGDRPRAWLDEAVDG